MDEIDKMCGIGKKITIKDKEYTLSPLRIKDLGEMTSFIKARRIKTLSLANPNMTIREKLDIANTEIAQEDFDTEMSTIDGAMFTVWLSLRHAHPSVTLKTVEDILDSNTMLKDLLSEINILGYEGKGKNVEKQTNPENQ